MAFFRRFTRVCSYELLTILVLKPRKIYFSYIPPFILQEVSQMKKIRSFSSFYILAFTQVAVSMVILAYMEFILNRLGFTATGSWEFYVFHLLFLLPCVLLLTPAGFFSDKYPKEKVLFWTTFLSFPAVSKLLAYCLW